MKEIGGYIELDTYRLPMLHDNAIKLNCGRNALAYLIETRNIKRIFMPKFMCNSCNEVLKKYGVEVKLYSIGLDFKPIISEQNTNDWLYVVNFYGQLSNDYLSVLKSKHINLIVDNAQAYFQMPVDGIDTLYTCRKFFGVADGAILYTDKQLERKLETDESYNRMNFLLGRFERTASEFYSEYAANNKMFAGEPIKKMSKLTDNLLHGVDYDFVKKHRTENFAYLHSKLKYKNKLQLSVSEGAFMYPFYIENGVELRKKLQLQKIYIPTLWPDVFDVCESSELEYNMAVNTLPLPVDQRYNEKDMIILVKEIHKCIN